VASSAPAGRTPPAGVEPGETVIALPAAARSRARAWVAAPAGALSSGVRRVPPRVALAILLAVPLLVVGWLWLRDSPLVSVSDVSVLGATGPEAPAIRATLEKAALDQSTLHVDAGVLQASVARYPLVRSLEVDAHPPHGLTVRVVSERPVAVLTGAAGRVAVSGEGKVLRAAPTRMALPEVPTTTPPVGGHVQGARALAALAVAAAAPSPLRVRLTRVGWGMRGQRGLTAGVSRGPVLVFGDASRAGAKWMAAVRVLADPSSSGAAYLDLRVPERPAAGGVAPPGQSQSSTLNQG